MKYLLFFLITIISQIGYTQTELVNKNATKEAKNLLSYIHELKDNILSGQHCYSHETDRFYDKAFELTGKYPAIWGTDFYWSGGNTDPGFKIVNDVIKKHKEGAIITLMWHVGKPSDNAPFGWKESVQSKISDADWKDLITQGTDIHNRWLNQVDQLAIHLKKIQQENIPVLWRPYHEMNGVWFWWGNKKGDEGFSKLWQLLYDRLTNYHQINNLIWVWNANAPRDIPEDNAFDYKDFYPGHSYVDILATDVYHFDYEQKDYNQLLELAEGKPIALGEVGQLPKPNILKAQPKWSWFMVWSGWLLTANTEERVKSIYNYPNTISKKNNATIFKLDFEKNNIGTYNEDNLTNDIGNANWSSIKNRASIEEDDVHGKVLKVFYPKGSIGPEQGGIQFDKPLPNADEYYLDYFLKFKDGFDFKLGGKLPGLTSGGSTFTGGVHPTKGEGWSARYMWKKQGEAIVYFYYKDMKGKWGDGIKMNTVFNTEKWYRITQHIKLNSDDKTNGIMEVWVDGNKVITNNKVRYRLAPLGQINSFYFSTFHGGNTPDWAPKNDSYIYFDDFKVTINKPEDLN
ncbi:glycosyl hydrolase [Thalassobellus sediminis]|uniref:glycosyl hydrolase n=1 Tax=Thalassobellus sediminis TaxID=3367753 RepID=UPI0037AB4226